MPQLRRLGLLTLAALVLALVLPTAALAQGSTVYQTGTVVPSHLAKFFTNGRIGDVGGINGQASSQYQQTFVGINLQVTPLINPEGLVVMDILQDVQQLGPSTIIDGNPVPTTSKRTAQATVSVRDRDTIILGGMISTSKSTSRSGVPGSALSAATPIARSPSAPTAASSDSCDRLESTTRAPSATRTSATARPSPREAPVTR